MNGEGEGPYMAEATRQSEDKKEVRLQVRMAAESLPSEEHPTIDEDAYFVDEKNHAFGLFDGMGGHAKGEVASTLAKEVVQSSFGKSLKEGMSLGDAENSVRDALVTANEKVYQEAQADRTKRGMGSTGIAGLVWEGPGGERKLVVGNCGDGRIYLLREGRLEQISIDDNNVALHALINGWSDEQLRQTQATLNNALEQNDLSSEQHDLYENRNKISNNIGSKSVRPRVYTVDLKAGDRILISSDGLHDNLTDSNPNDPDNIQSVLSGNPDDEIAVRKLVEAANARSRDENHFRSKYDDITAVVVSISTPEIEPEEVDLSTVDARTVSGTEPNIHPTPEPLPAAESGLEPGQQTAEPTQTGHEVDGEFQERLDGWVNEREKDPKERNARRIIARQIVGQKGLSREEVGKRTSRTVRRLEKALSKNQKDFLAVSRRDTETGEEVVTRVKKEGDNKWVAEEFHPVYDNDGSEVIREQTISRVVIEPDGTRLTLTPQGERYKNANPNIVDDDRFSEAAVTVFEYLSRNVDSRSAQFEGRRLAPGERRDVEKLMGKQEHDRYVQEARQRVESGEDAEGNALYTGLQRSFAESPTYLRFGPVATTYRQARESADRMEDPAEVQKAIHSLKRFYEHMGLGKYEVVIETKKETTEEERRDLIRQKVLEDVAKMPEQFAIFRMSDYIDHRAKTNYLQDRLIETYSVGRVYEQGVDIAKTPPRQEARLDAFDMQREADRVFWAGQRILVEVEDDDVTQEYLQLRDERLAPKNEGTVPFNDRSDDVRARLISQRTGQLRLQIGASKGDKTAETFDHLLGFLPDEEKRELIGNMVACEEEITASGENFADAVNAEDAEMVAWAVSQSKEAKVRLKVRLAELDVALAVQRSRDARSRTDQVRRDIAEAALGGGPVRFLNREEVEKGLSAIKERVSAFVGGATSEVKKEVVPIVGEAFQLAAFTDDELLGRATRVAGFLDENVGRCAHSRREDLRQAGQDLDQLRDRTQHSTMKVDLRRSVYEMRHQASVTKDRAIANFGIAASEAGQRFALGVRERIGGSLLSAEERQGFSETRGGIGEGARESHAMTNEALDRRIDENPHLEKFWTQIDRYVRDLRIPEPEPAQAAETPADAKTSSPQAPEGGAPAEAKTGAGVQGGALPQEGRAKTSPPIEPPARPGEQKTVEEALESGVEWERRDDDARSTKEIWTAYWGNPEIKAVWQGEAKSKMWRSRQEGAVGVIEQVKEEEDFERQILQMVNEASVDVAQRCRTRLIQNESQEFREDLLKSVDGFRDRFTALRMMSGEEDKLPQHHKDLIRTLRHLDHLAAEIYTAELPGRKGELLKELDRVVKRREEVFQEVNEEGIKLVIPEVPVKKEKELREGMIAQNVVEVSYKNGEKEHYLGWLEKSQEDGKDVYKVHFEAVNKNGERFKDPNSGEFVQPIEDEEDPEAAGRNWVEVRIPAHVRTEADLFGGVDSVKAGFEFRKDEGNWILVEKEEEGFDEESVSEKEAGGEEEAEQLEMEVVTPEEFARMRGIKEGVKFYSIQKVTTPAQGGKPQEIHHYTYILNADGELIVRETSVLGEEIKDKRSSSIKNEKSDDGTFQDEKDARDKIAELARNSQRSGETVRNVILEKEIVPPSDFGDGVEHYEIVEEKDEDEGNKVFLTYTYKGGVVQRQGTKRSGMPYGKDDEHKPKKIKEGLGSIEEAKDAIEEDKRKAKEGYGRVVTTVPKYRLVTRLEELPAEGPEEGKRELDDLKAKIQEKLSADGKLTVEIEGEKEGEVKEITVKPFELLYAVDETGENGDMYGCFSFTEEGDLVLTNVSPDAELGESVIVPPNNQLDPGENSGKAAGETIDLFIDEVQKHGYKVSRMKLEAEGPEDEGTTTQFTTPPSAPKGPPTPPGEPAVELQQPELASEPELTAVEVNAESGGGVEGRFLPDTEKVVFTENIRGKGGEGIMVGWTGKNFFLCSVDEEGKQSSPRALIQDVEITNEEEAREFVKDLLEHAYGEEQPGKSETSSAKPDQ